ncbi:MAG TPA: DsbA family protein [Chitinophagaceae bacterium]|nr:DsbA family protein [Chitinophagaceae bacterium]
MSKLKPAVNSRDHVQGNANAPIELVEYGDYQCPHCGRAYPIIKSIQEKMGNQLKFVFRNFPLAKIHPNAINAAIATEAAALQDKFWEMHDYIFEHQDRLDDVSLIKYAAQLRLDVEQFENDFEKQDLAQKVDDDFESGVRSGVNGTPSFYVHGEKYNGSWDEASFLDYLQGLLK